MAEDGSTQYQVQDLILDIRQRQVRRGEENLQLGGLTFDLLRVLVEFAPHIVTYDELAEKVWSGRPVSPETITQRAMMLRQALGDSAETPRYFEVIRGHGFKLIADVKTEQSIPEVAGRKLKFGALVVLVLAAAFLLVDKLLPSTSEITSPSQLDSDSLSSDKNSLDPVRQFTIDIGMTRPKGGAQLNADIALTPDGKHLVFSAQRDEVPQLYLRELDQLESNPIPGTETGQVPIISTDGKWIAYIGVGGVFKIPLRGGTAQFVIDDQVPGAGGAWLEDGSLIITSSRASGNHLLRIGPEPDKSEFLNIGNSDPLLTYSWPHALPGATHLLVTGGPPEAARDSQILSLSLETGETESLIQGGFNARYVSTGHVVFMRSNDLWAVPFDLERNQIIGSEVLMVENIQVGGNRGQAVYAFTDDGTLIYLPGADRQAVEISNRRILVWVDRNGVETPLDLEPQSYRLPRLSPDNGRLAIDIQTSSSDSDTWIYDFDRKTLSRLTFGSSFDEGAIWTRDGEQIIYASYSNGRGIYIKNPDGLGGQRILLVAMRSGWPESLSPDDQDLLYSESPQGGETANWDGYSISLDGDSSPEVLLSSQFSETQFSISPNGKWVAYSSNETGQLEVYVRPYPELDTKKMQISTSGGGSPRWRADGQELFYRTSDGVMAANIEASDEFTAGVPELVFARQYSVLSASASADLASRHWDVASDGQKFLMIKDLDEEDPEIEAMQTSLVVIDNWFNELKRLVPANQ